MCERIVILLRTRCFSLPLACRSPVVKSLGIVRPNANGLTEVLHRSVKVTFNAVSRESGGERPGCRKFTPHIVERISI